MKLLLVMLKGVEMLEASAFIDVFGWYRDILKGKIDVVTCGFNKQLKSSFNLTFSVDILLEDVDFQDYDAIMIPGGFGYYGFYEEAYNSELLNLIREFDNNNRFIATVCVGAFPVAKSGVLNGRNGTTYNLMNGRRQKQINEMGVNIINKPIVIDKNIITSWGPSTAPEVALCLLEMLTSKEIKEEVRTIMGF